MLIAGAGGHAKDIVASVTKNIFDELNFFDDVTDPKVTTFLNKYNVISSLTEVEILFKKNRHFIIGIGGPKLREKISMKLIAIGGKMENFISKNATIGNDNVEIGIGLNIMPGVFISNDVLIGEGTLVNTASSIHHGCRIGKYCEISPGSRILGDVSIGDFTSIGANSSILPGITMGSNVVVGSGSVVTKNVPDGVVVAGVPAKQISMSH